MADGRGRRLASRGRLRYRTVADSAISQPSAKSVALHAAPSPHPRAHACRARGAIERLRCLTAAVHGHGARLGGALIAGLSAGRQAGIKTNPAPRASAAPGDAAGRLPCHGRAGGRGARGLGKGPRGGLRRAAGRLPSAGQGRAAGAGPAWNGLSASSGPDCFDGVRMAWERAGARRPRRAAGSGLTRGRRGPGCRALRAVRMRSALVHYATTGPGQERGEGVGARGSNAACAGRAGALQTGLVSGMALAGLPEASGERPGCRDGAGGSRASARTDSSCRGRGARSAARGVGRRADRGGCAERGGHRRAAAGEDRAGTRDSWNAARHADPTRRSPPGKTTARTAGRRGAIADPATGQVPGESSAAPRD